MPSKERRIVDFLKVAVIPGVKKKQSPPQLPEFKGVNDEYRMGRH